MARPVPAHLATAQTAIQRAIFRQLWADVAAVLPEDDTPLSPSTVNAVLREVDASLDALFGRTRGDTDAVLYRLLVASDHAARLAPLTEAVRAYRDVLPARVLDAIETEARR